MMTNGFGCILGGIVSGKVVEMYTQNGITDWQTVWLIFAGYSVVLAFAFMAMFKYKGTSPVITPEGEHRRGD